MMVCSQARGEPSGAKRSEPRIGAQQRVLNQVLRVRCVARQLVGRTVQGWLMRQNQPLKLPLLLLLLPSGRRCRRR
jgi:hypothetical protein